VRRSEPHHTGSCGVGGFHSISPNLSDRRLNGTAGMKDDNKLSDTHAEDLVNSLVAAAGALIEHLASQGVTGIPQRQYIAHWMEPAAGDDTRSSGKTALYVEPALERIQLIYNEHLAELPPMADLGAKLKRFADGHGGFPASGWLSSPTDIAGRVLREYLTRSASLSVDKAVARQVIQDYCVDLSEPTITVRSIFQVDGFTAAYPFSLSDEVEVRPISQEDIKEQARGALVPFPYARPWLNSRDWICEVNKRGPRDTFEAVNWDSEGTRYIATTLALTSPGAAHLTLLRSQHASPFLAVGWKSGGEPTFTGRGGAPLHLAGQGIRVAQKLYPKVVSVLAGTGPQPLRLALGRLIAAAQRRETEDRLVDYVIGLESLLAPDTDRLETTIRFRLRGAALLPPHFGKHRERIDLMNKLYDVRSRAVHGGADKDTVVSYVAKAEDALRHVLRWFMDDSRWKNQPKAIVKELDQRMVQGGSKWAYPIS